jgi:hypothetical protein
MPGPAPGALNVRAKTNHIVNYHYDEVEPGKPLYLLIPGGLIALGSLALIVYLAYATWFDGSMDQSTGLSLILVLAPFYIGGVFLFSYGYELYNIPKALRDTAIIVFITLAAVVIIAVLFFVIGELGGGRSSGSSNSKSSASSHSGSTASIGGGGGGGGWIGGAGPLFINTGSGTHTVTHEVVREVPVAPPAPQPITCPNCGRSYVPSENHFACPNCGAPTPPELTEASSPGAQDQA